MAWRCISVRGPVVARWSADKHAGIFQRQHLTDKRIGVAAAGRIHPVHRDDVVLRAMGDNPLEGGLYFPGAARLEGDDFYTGRDALVELAIVIVGIGGNFAGATGAVGIVVVGEDIPGIGVE